MSADDDRSFFARWPLLLAAVVLVGTGLALDFRAQEVAPFAVACLIMGASAFGAFLYAEGARHREWWQAQRRGSHESDTEDRPGAPGPPPSS